MSSDIVRHDVPGVVVTGAVIIVVGSFALAVVAAQLFLWLFSIVSITFSAFVLYLFFRLVVAVEAIADKL
ncbi:hypothetical protein ACLI4Y_17605 [Natrialbaceae archaeon A-CW3]